MRRCIRSAASAGYRPSEIRAMSPRDWYLIVASHHDANSEKGPGEDAPDLGHALEMKRRLDHGE